MRRTYFRSGTLPDNASSSHVTLSLPVKSPPLRRILHRTYFRTGHVTDVTSGHIISGCSSSLLLKCGFVRADILLIIPTYIRMLSFDWLIKGIFFFNNSQFFQFLPHHRLRGHANFPRCSGNLLHLSFSQIILANRIYLYIILTCSISVNDIYKYGIL